MLEQKKYIPALHFHFLTPFYDFLISIFMREKSFKKRLIQLADISNGMKILDVGCGTGTLEVMIKDEFPNVNILGVDCDKTILELARKKATKRKLDITFEYCSALRFPYIENQFDRVLSSLVIHHLDVADWEKSFLEVNRVLKKNGEFCIVDFGPPSTIYNKILAPFITMIEHHTENLKGTIPVLLKQCNFREVIKISELNTLFGTLVYYNAIK